MSLIASILCSSEFRHSSTRYVNSNLKSLMKGVQQNGQQIDEEDLEDVVRHFNFWNTTC